MALFLLFDYTTFDTVRSIPLPHSLTISCPLFCFLVSSLLAEKVQCLLSHNEPYEHKGARLVLAPVIVLSMFELRI